MLSNTWRRGSAEEWANVKICRPGRKVAGWIERHKASKDGDS